jgi:dTDP-glucose 4,6-dehydratase
MNAELQRIVVTGGAGFIGSAVCRALIATPGMSIINVDNLTYAANMRSLASIRSDERYSFVKADICDKEAMESVFAKYEPTGILHLAAESHVDRSISGPDAFVNTNVVGTYRLLEAANRHFGRLSGSQKSHFRFVHVSTDEVYGSLGDEGYFREDTPYQPSSPYSATKAASDHLAHAWHTTYGLPVIVTNCSNNYGPCQFPEKLIPLTIINALKGRPLPVYGTGANVRDWLYVDDHARGLITAFKKGNPGEKYNFGGNSERNNLTVVKLICDTLDRLMPTGTPRQSLITFVTDRPGHDQTSMVASASAL